MAEDLFSLLKKDHEKVKKILDQLEDTTERAAKKREDLFAQLKIELQPHMEAEENVYYPALMNDKDAKKTALESIEEHHVAKLMLAELETTYKTSEIWGAKIKVFKEILEHHIEEEEDELFEKTKEALNKEKLMEITLSFKEAKTQIKMKM